MFISDHSKELVFKHENTKDTSHISGDQSNMYSEFAKSLSNKFFEEKNLISVENFEANITTYSNLTNTIFRKHKLKSNKEKVTLRCFYFKKNGSNKSSFLSPCPFKLIYQINGDSISVVNITHEHNHPMMNTSDFNEIQARNRLTSFENDLNYWMKTSVLFNSQKDSLSLTPKNIRKLLEKDNLIDVRLKKMIE